MSENINEYGQPIGAFLPDWEPCLLPDKVSMSGRYCRIEPTELGRDAADLYEAYSQDGQDEDWTYLSYGPFETLDEFEAWMKEIMQGRDPLFFTIIDLKTDKAAGLASYLRMAPNYGCIEVGHIHFSRLLQRTPAATEAMYLLMRYVFDELGYRRYEWKCDALNGPSRRAAERLGFTYEGLFRQHLVYKGRNRDTAWFSILDSEWPALKARFEAWLDPSNFAENGTQKIRLTDTTSS